MRVRRAALPVVLALAAALCAAEGLHRRSDPAGAAGVDPTTGAPIVSASRLPAALARLTADQRLAAGLDAVFADPAVSRNQSCLEVDDAGVPVYARDAATALAPASNVKLLTATAALARLGPDARFTTSVAAARPASGGVVDGPLYLMGGGDPLLATDGYRPSLQAWTESREPITRLATLADLVRAAGVTRVRGGVVGDDTRYDDQRTLPTWSPSYLSSDQVGPVGALIVDGGTVTVGRRRVAADDPAQAAAAAFRALLVARGVIVQGPATHGTAPPGTATVVSIQSPPLTTILGEALRESDNLAAEMVTKELGRRFGGAGTWAAGLAVIHATLAAAGVPLDGVVQLDGSGLERQDRAPCRTLAALAAGRLEPELPVAGQCGTLVGRFVGQPSAGRVVAKTGSLIGVVALSGAVTAAPVPPEPCPPAAIGPAARVTFSLIVNGTPSIAAGEAIEDRVAAVLAAYAAGA